MGQRLGRAIAQKARCAQRQCSGFLELDWYEQLTRLMQQLGIGRRRVIVWRVRSPEDGGSPRRRAAAERRRQTKRPGSTLIMLLIGASRGPAAVVWWSGKYDLPRSCINSAQRLVKKNCMRNPFFFRPVANSRTFCRERSREPEPPCSGACVDCALQTTNQLTY